MEEGPHERLARHLSAMAMGLPYRETLVDILKECLTGEEAEVALLLPTNRPPLQTVAVNELAASGAERDRISQVLETLAERGLVFSGRTADGRPGYALHQVGFGFPQTFFWKGEDTPHARKMTQLVAKYFNRQVTAEAFGGNETKPYRYVPVNQSLKPEVQAVYPHHLMDSVIESATTFAVAHCPCRVELGLLGKACQHPLEVCIKFDEMAQYLIDRGLGRQIDREEARRIVEESARAGLVHFVDNADGPVKHNCNCCGCACWNVGSIRRRKIPRDALMAVYFLRETDEDRCSGCGECVDICPVAAVSMEDGRPVVDAEWCIGCGVCATKCDFDAIAVEPRGDRPAMPEDFQELYLAVEKEKGEPGGETGA